MAKSTDSKLVDVDDRAPLAVVVKVPHTDLSEVSVMVLVLWASGARSALGSRLRLASSSALDPRAIRVPGARQRSRMIGSAEQRSCGAAESTDEVGTVVVLSSSLGEKTTQVSRRALETAASGGLLTSPRPPGCFLCLPTRP